jgi:hypothetical protein
MLLDHGNIEQIFDKPGELQKFITALFAFELEITQKDNLSQNVRQFYDNYLF